MERAAEKQHVIEMQTDPRTLAKEHTARRKLYDLQSVPPSEVKDFEADGWEEDRVLKTRVRMRRERPHDRRLENRVWCLFYKLGYPELSAGHDFQVLIRRRGAGDLYKQIDVLARDEETVLVVECKSREVPGKRSLQQDLAEFASLKGPFSNAINAHYRSRTKPKILWIFVTNNIVWSQPDIERAKGHSIHRVTERELGYYEQLANHLGPAARFQFLAEFLAGQQIPALKGRKVPAIRGKLGGYTYYSFVTTPQELFKIAFVNHRTLNDPTALPSYQRLVTRSRILKIGAFIQGGGFFPTNLLVNFKTKTRFEIVQKDDDTGVRYGYLYLPDRYKSAWVIDGQHRLYGYSRLEDRHLRDNLLVVAFDRLPTDDEARLFVTINHEQKSVPRTLLDDLQGDLHWGSDVPSERIGALASRIIQELNDSFGRPFYNRVTRQGITATAHTCLTIPALRQGLLTSRLVGEVMLRRHYHAGPLTAETDPETLVRACSFLNGYFARIQMANPELWDRGREGYLCTNVGVQGFMLLASSIIGHMSGEDGLVATDLSVDDLLSEVTPYLEPIARKLENADEAWVQTQFKVQYGTGGRRQYHFRLCRMVREIEPRFCPSGYTEWLEEQSEERITRARDQLREIEIKVHTVIFDAFKQEYGEDYFETGVSNAKMRVKAYERQQEDSQRLPLDNYLQFLDYSKIVAAKEHWRMFKGVFNIPEPGDKGLAKNLKWMDRINELRRIPAHPTGGRGFTMGDFEYLEWIHAELFSRVSQIGE